MEDLPPSEDVSLFPSTAVDSGVARAARLLAAIGVEGGKFCDIDVVAILAVASIGSLVVAVVGEEGKEEGGDGGGGGGGAIVVFSLEADSFVQERGRRCNEEMGQGI